MLTPNFIDCRSIFRWIYLELVVCVWRDKLQKSTDWLLAVVNRFPTWYFTAFFEWLGNLQFTGINIYFKSVLMFRDLSFCLWFFCQSIAQITVLKDNRQQCLYELMKMKKKYHYSYFLLTSVIIIIMYWNSTTYLEKYGNLTFFYVSNASIFGQNQRIFKKKIHYLFY